MNFLNLLPTVTGICGSLFLGYCVYFDRKRRSDPDYKKKLHKRRNPKIANKKKAVVRFPNLNDALACQSFFLVELGKASQCFDEEKIDEGIDHVANSLVVYDEERRKCLMLMFHGKYPPSIVHAIIQRIPEAETRLHNYHNSVQGGEEEKESGIATRFPNTTDGDACHKFVTEEMALANGCVEEGDFSGASDHYANVIVIVDENERHEILIKLRKNLGNDFFSLILQATGPAQKRLREKLLREDQRLALKFLISLPLLCMFASGILR